jgi:ribosome recycling factor
MSDAFKDAELRMSKGIEMLKHEFHKIRTGSAHPSLLEHIKVHSYGSDVPLSQVANITIGDSRTLVITPWDKSMVGEIEKAIHSSDLGLNPMVAGQIMRVPLPPLTEERRRDLAKVVKSEAEAARVATRNIRRDILQGFKDAHKRKEVTEDELKKAEERVQKLTDKTIVEIDRLALEKEKDLMSI